MEKKCFNCKHIDICAMYHELLKMASLLNRNMNKSIDEKPGFVNMVDTMAHDCNKFDAFEGE